MLRISGGKRRNMGLLLGGDDCRRTVVVLSRLDRREQAFDLGCRRGHSSGFDLRVGAWRFWKGSKVKRGLLEGLTGYWAYESLAQ